VLTVEFDDEMILDEMLVSYYSQRPTTVYHRFHKEYNGEMVMEYSRKLGLPKKVLNDITAYVRDNCSVLVAFKRSNVVCPELEKVYGYFNNRFPDRYTDVKTMTEFARNQLINDEDGKARRFLLFSSLGHPNFKIGWPYRPNHIVYVVPHPFQVSSPRPAWSDHGCSR